MKYSSHLYFMHVRKGISLNDIIRLHYSIRHLVRWVLVCVAYFLEVDCCIHSSVYSTNSIYHLSPSSGYLEKSHRPAHLSSPSSSTSFLTAPTISLPPKSTPGSSTFLAKSSSSIILSLLTNTPIGGFFLGEVVEGASNFRKILNETTIEVCKA